MFLSGAGVGWLIGLSVSPVIYIVITSLIAFVVSITSALAGITVDREGTQAESRPASKRIPQVEINPLPVMFMVLGLVIGASLGVYARTNNWLGPNPASFVEQWKDTELSKREISRRLFDELYPPGPESRPASGTADLSTNNDQQPPESGVGGPAADDNSSSTSSSEKGESQDTSPASKKGRSPSQKPKASSNPDVVRKHLGVLFTATSEECARFIAARDERLKDELMTGSNEWLRQEAEKCPNLGCLKNLVVKACAKSK